jgi:hypothetical protein
VTAREQVGQIDLFEGELHDPDKHLLAVRAGWLAGWPQRALGPFAGSCWEITVHFSLSAGAAPDFLFTLRFTEGLFKSVWVAGAQTACRVARWCGCG